MQGGEEDVEGAMASIFVWLRYSAARHLTWQRNYNTQPRILGEAQAKLTHKIAEVSLAFSLFKLIFNEYSQPAMHALWAQQCSLYTAYLVSWEELNHHISCANFYLQPVIVTLKLCYVCIMSAPLRLVLMQAHGRTGGLAQEWVRNMLGCVGRGGNAQAIRDEILNIMHRNHIGEKRGTWMEVQTCMPA